MLLRGKEAFETQWERWKNGEIPKWTDVEEKDREQFVQNVIETIDKEEEKVDGVECLAYLAMGCWGETAGVEEETGEQPRTEDAERDQWGGMQEEHFPKSTTQIEWIRKGCELLARCGAVKCAFDVLRRACDGEQSVGPLPLIRPMSCNILVLRLT